MYTNLNDILVMNTKKNSTLVLKEAQKKNLNKINQKEALKIKKYATY